MQAKLQLLLARTSLAFASSTRSRGRFVAVKSFGLFSVMLVLGLLMSFQGMATSIDMTTTIISTPATGGTAVGYSTVSFSAITTNPSNSQTFNGVQQQIAISGVSTALYTALTFSGTGTVSYSSATSTVTIVFPTADLAKNTSRTESENLVVPGNVTPASITAAVSYNNISGADTDPTLR